MENPGGVPPQVTGQSPDLRSTMVGMKLEVSYLPSPQGGQRAAGGNGVALRLDSPTVEHKSGIQDDKHGTGSSRTL